MFRLSEARIELYPVERERYGPSAAVRSLVDKTTRDEWFEAVFYERGVPADYRLSAGR